jgi:hypothetical protein
MSTVNVNRVVDSSGGVLAPISSVMRNRIINGAMVINQRGGTVTVNSGSQNFSVDRWWGQGTASAGVFTMQNSTVAPAGFTNSLLVTVTTADASLAANDLYDFAQFIEGFNVADLGYGTANAKTVTLSFWVRSSVTGTFGGALGNNAGNRGYPFTYTINAANTFEYKTVTIAGDTTGTWTTDNSIGLRVYFGLGAGSTFSGTAGAWGSSLFLTATGATNLMATSGATFYITGVQLEVGTQATSFEYRQYQQELALCQRYYYKMLNTSGNINGESFGAGVCVSTTITRTHTTFPVTLRAAPTALEQTGTAGDYRVLVTAPIVCSAVPIFAFASASGAQSIFTVASGFTAGNAVIAGSQTNSSYLAWSAEL